MPASPPRSRRTVTPPLFQSFSTLWRSAAAPSIASQTPLVIPPDVAVIPSQPDPCAPVVAIAAAPPQRPVSLRVQLPTPLQADPLRTGPSQRQAQPNQQSPGNPSPTPTGENSRLPRWLAVILGDPWQSRALIPPPDPSILRATSLQRSPQAADPFSPRPRLIASLPSTAHLMPTSRVRPGWVPVDPLRPGLAATIPLYRPRLTNSATPVVTPRPVMQTQAQGTEPTAALVTTSGATDMTAAIAAEAEIVVLETPKPIVTIAQPAMAPVPAPAPRPVTMAMMPRPYGIDPFLALRRELVPTGIASDPLQPGTRPILPTSHQSVPPLLAAGDPLAPPDSAPTAPRRRWLRLLSGWWQPSAKEDERRSA